MSAIVAAAAAAATATAANSSTDNKDVSIEAVAELVYYSVLDSTNTRAPADKDKPFPFSTPAMQQHCTSMTFISHNLLQFLISKGRRLVRVGVDTDNNKTSFACTGMRINVAHDGEEAEHVWNSFDFEPAAPAAPGDASCCSFSIDLSLRQFAADQVAPAAAAAGSRPWSLLNEATSFPLLSANGTEIKHPDAHGLLLRPVYAPIIDNDDVFVLFYKQMLTCKLQGGTFTFHNSTTGQEDVISKEVVSVFLQVMSQAMKRIRDVLKV
jgi:hypothetical protein